MANTHPRMRRERKTIEILHQIYCHDHHGGLAGELCPECQELCDYAVQRLERCPFQEDKSTCANCAVHCYKPEMRARIREIMIYAGPRMLRCHPVLAVRHLIDGRRKPPRLPRRKATIPKS
jgi:hypothetical protein